MSEYLHKYLRQTFGLEQMAVEWAYSLHDAAPRFTSDPQIALFWSVLIDEVRWTLSICNSSLIGVLVVDRDHVAFATVGKRKNFLKSYVIPSTNVYSITIPSATDLLLQLW